MLRIFCVVVLYERSMAQSNACRALASLPAPGGMQLSGLIFDNTPGRDEEIAPVGRDFNYVAAGRNLGLPTAYNMALRDASTWGADYLLLIDQDSWITQDFLDAAQRALMNPTPQNVAWVPRVFVGDRIISPYRITAAGLPVFGRANAPNARYFAINSYSVISLPFLASIGGFDGHYWLDALDSWFYSRVAATGNTVGIIDVSVRHSLSLLEGPIPAWRLLNIAHYETCFLWECLSLLQAFVGTLRVIVRGGRNARGLASAGKLIAYALASLNGARSGLARRSRALL